MKNIITILLSVVALLVVCSGNVLAQGVTTAGMQGTVTDTNGEPLIGATVIAVHEPTGARYGKVTNVDGRYVLPNLAVGGPYTLTVSYIGFEPKVLSGINLSLGKTARFDVELEEATDQLQEVEIIAERNEIIDPTRTGSATNITTEQIQALPTLNRSLSDFARLSPQFSETEDGGLSFAGQNNRYNNLMIDGAVNNDVFGLNDNGSPGGRTGIQPINLEAVKEVQITLAPFDVRQSGFTGAGVNVITKSGTNKIFGSVYHYLQSERLAGKSIPTERNPERESINQFEETQSGFSLGGPIKKDELFFFVAGDVTQQVRPYSTDLLAPVDSVREFVRIIRDVYGYDPGNPYAELQDVNKGYNLFTRLDWNINVRHKLMVRYNYLNAFTNDIFRSTGSYSFNTSQAEIKNVTNSFALELNSSLSNNASNQLRLVYTKITDERVPAFETRPFPQIVLDNGGQDLIVGDGRFNALNSLDQDLFTLTDSYTWYRGDHTFVVGTHNELYFFDNLFIESGFGEWTFSSLTDLEQGNPIALRKDYSLTDKFDQSASWGAVGLSLFAQDEWLASENLTLTLGLRADLPLIIDEVARNSQFEKSFYRRNDLTPKNNILWSPRLGFNWNVDGEDDLQVRGGVGIFSGKSPYVWLSNQYSKNGIQFGSARFGLSQIQQIFADLSEQERLAAIGDPYYVPDPSLIARTVEVDITNPNFKLPQSLRTNLGVDKKLPGDVFGTVEFMYSKTLNDIYVRNINLLGVRGQNANGRNLWGEGPYDPDLVDGRNFTDVYVLENSNRGYQMSFTAKLEKRTDNFFATVAYNRSIAKDLKSSTSSIAGGNWASAAIVQDPNNPDLAFSDFDVPHRLVGSLTYIQRWSDFTETSIGLFYNGQSGRRFSYVYDGDVNFDSRDTRNNNDLVFVPDSRDDIIFTGSEEEQLAQWEALNAFIDNDDYLSTRRGQFAERNGAIAPWRNTFDLALKQDIAIVAGGHRHALTASFDIFNLGNLINKDWGVAYSVNNARLLVVDDIDPETKLPIVTFEGDATTSPYLVNRFVPSVWRMKVGLRYSF